MGLVIFSSWKDGKNLLANGYRHFFVCHARNYTVNGVESPTPRVLRSIAYQEPCRQPRWG